MSADNQHWSGCFKSYTSFDADDRISHMHVTADTVCCTDFFHLLDGSDFVFEYFTVHSMDFTVFEFKTKFFAASLCHLFQISTFRQTLCGVENFAAADGSSPQTYIVGIFQFREVCFEAMFFQIVDFVVAAQCHIACQRDDLDIRSQHQECHVEADLVVSGSCGTVGDRIGTDLVCIAGDCQRLKNTFRTDGDRISTVTEYISEDHIFQALFIIFFCYVNCYIFSCP